MVNVLFMYIYNLRQSLKDFNYDFCIAFEMFLEDSFFIKTKSFIILIVTK